MINIHCVDLELISSYIDTKLFHRTYSDLNNGRSVIEGEEIGYPITDALYIYYVTEKYRAYLVSKRNKLILKDIQKNRA